MKLRIRKLMYEEIGGARADYLFSMFARLCEGLAETLYMVLWAQRILYGGSIKSIGADTGFVDFVALTVIMFLMVTAMAHQKESFRGILSRKGRNSISDIF